MILRGILLLIFFSTGYWISQNTAPMSTTVVSQTTKPSNTTIPSSLNFIFETQLTDVVSVKNIELRGLIQSTDNSKSLAVVSLNNQPVKYFSIDENIEKGIKLKNIMVDHIIIEENGIRRKIKAVNLNTFLRKK